MKQVFIIHGGDSFLSYNDYLFDLKSTVLDYQRIQPRKRLKDTIIEKVVGADILTPTMPNSANAQFEEWSIWFEKMIPFFSNNVRLIGHSLGAMFLAKYLHNHPLTIPVRQLIILAGGYDKDMASYGSFALESATGLEKSAYDIHLFHSKDDFVVPFEELAKYQADLPMAHVHIFENRNHFLDPELPELIKLLKQK